MDVGLNGYTIYPPSSENVAEWVLEGYYTDLPEETSQKEWDNGI